jgi:hypothetical protein
MEVGMRCSFVVVFAAGLLAFAVSARAQTQLYNFENDAQGFGPNGFPAPTVQQSTTGATEGTHALQFALGQNQTFSGALTQTVDQPALLDPATKALALDVTIVPGQNYTGTGFASLGVSYFGADPAHGVFGVPIQTNGPSEQNVALAPGTYHLTVPLISTAGTPIRDAFGTGAGQLPVVSGLQFYISKSGDSPLTVYIDNVRAVPEPAGCAALLGLLAFASRRRR